MALLWQMPSYNNNFGKVCQIEQSKIVAQNYIKNGSVILKLLLRNVFCRNVLKNIKNIHLIKYLFFPLPLYDQ